MTVTNNIRDNVVYDNENGWYETKLTNEEIEDKLLKEKNRGFLVFSWRGLGDFFSDVII